MKKVILASQSATRRKILEDMGIFPQIIPTNADENYGNLTVPAEIVTALSEIKAQWIKKNTAVDESTLIITADTLVFFNGTPIGKPKDLDDARRTLTALSENEHFVYTGFTLMYAGKSYTDYECTKVIFRKLSAHEIERYTDNLSCLSKSGSYGAEGMGAAFIKRTEGDYLNIGGLPVCKISEALADIFGVSIFDFSS